VTLTEVTAQQPGRQLTGVRGYYDVYPEDYVFDAARKLVTLKLCPTIGEKVDFTFTESSDNYGIAHVTLNGVEVARDDKTGSHVANIQAVATADAPLKLRSFVDASVDGSGLNFAPSIVFEYDVKVELFQNPIDHKKCYQAGPR
jgi:hypothetical protein